jgi:dCTP deaminase
MTQPAGILPDRALKDGVEAGWIRADTPLADGQIQPASLDLRLARRVWRLAGELSAGRRPSRGRSAG